MHDDDFSEPHAVQAILNLPEFPELVDACDTDETTVELVLYRERLSDANIALGYVSESDAQAYLAEFEDETDGEDDAGNGWFVGYRRL